MSNTPQMGKIGRRSGKVKERRKTITKGAAALFDHFMKSLRQKDAREAGKSNPMLTKPAPIERRLERNHRPKAELTNLAEKPRCGVIARVIVVRRRPAHPFENARRVTTGKGEPGSIVGVSPRLMPPR